MYRLMIVDDDAILTTHLEELLAMMGYSVVAVSSSGKEAIDIARQVMPDLILMDILFPDQDMDGIEAAGIINQDLDIPVVFISGHSREEIVQRSRTSGAYGYLSKPLSAEQIKPTVEIAIYQKEADRKLRKAYDELDRRVMERTAELTRANQQLIIEIAERKRVNLELQEKESELEYKSLNLAETNAALKVLLKQRKEDRLQLEEKVIANVREFVLPFIERLKQTGLTETQSTFTGIVETNLKDITAPFSPKLSPRYMTLTPNEIHVVNLVKQGKRTREIADLLDRTYGTVGSRRCLIRKKIGIKGKKANLRTQLLSYQ
ncbi:MAG: response regulator [Deltaproteobacteria bacterium]|nr:response regulator [Deltaproteobacteria bacterium]